MQESYWDLDDTDCFTTQEPLSTTKHSLARNGIVKYLFCRRWAIVHGVTNSGREILLVVERHRLQRKLH
jgi:hypothetical protein